MINYQKLRSKIRQQIGGARAKDAAKGIGISESTLSRFIAGSGLSLEAYGLVCDWLGVSLDAFWEGKSSPLAARMLSVADRLEEYTAAARPIEAIIHVLREEFGEK